MWLLDLLINFVFFWNWHQEESTNPDQSMWGCLRVLVVFLILAGLCLGFWLLLLK